MGTFTNFNITEQIIKVKIFSGEDILFDGASTNFGYKERSVKYNDYELKPFFDKNDILSFYILNYKNGTKKDVFVNIQMLHDFKRLHNGNVSVFLEGIEDDPKIIQMLLNTKIEVVSDFFLNHIDPKFIPLSCLRFIVTGDNCRTEIIIPKEKADLSDRLPG
jgi:hypothetical protein